MQIKTALFVLLFYSSCVFAVDTYYVWDNATESLTIPKLVDELIKLEEQISYMKQELAQLDH